LFGPNTFTVLSLLHSLCYGQTERDNDDRNNETLKLEITVTR